MGSFTLEVKYEYSEPDSYPLYCTIVHVLYSSMYMVEIFSSVSVRLLGSIAK